MIYNVKERSASGIAYSRGKGFMLIKGREIMEFNKTAYDSDLEWLTKESPPEWLDYLRNELRGIHNHPDYPFSEDIRTQFEMRNAPDTVQRAREVLTIKGLTPIEIIKTEERNSEGDLLLGEIRKLNNTFTKIKNYILFIVIVIAICVGISIAITIVDYATVDRMMGESHSDDWYTEESLDDWA
jgi:hypothetical protein